MDAPSAEVEYIMNLNQDAHTEANPVQLPDLVHVDDAKQNARIRSAIVEIIINGGINAINLFNITLVSCGVNDREAPIKSCEIYNEVCSKSNINLIGMSYKNTSLTFTTASDFVNFANTHLISNKANTPIIATIQPPPLIFLKATANTIALNIFKIVWAINEKEINIPSREDFKPRYAMTDVNNFTSKLDPIIIKLILEKIKGIQPFGQEDILTHTIRKDDFILISNMSSKTMYCMVADCYELFSIVYTSSLPTSTSSVRPNLEDTYAQIKKIQRESDKTRRIGNTNPSI